MPALDLQAARLAGVAAVRAAAVVTEAVRADLQAADSVGKADKSPVTVADFAAQAILVLRLRDAFPAIPVVAEEDADALRESSELCGRVVARVQACPGCEALSPDAILEAIDTGRASPPGPAAAGETAARYFWCIDPIDGTKGFLRNDQYAVCLGLVRVSPDGRGTAVVGVLGCPNLPPAGAAADAAAPRGAILHAALGAGAAMEAIDGGAAAEIRVASAAVADTVCVESVEPGHTDQEANASLCTAVGISRPPVRMDSQCKYAVVARGEAGLYLRSADYPQNIWDHAAGAAIVAEAGGCVTDARGAALDFGAGRQLTNNTPSLLTSHGGALHGVVVREIALALGAQPSPAGPSPAVGAAEGEGGGFGGGLRLREAKDEADVQGAAALLELCDVEFVFPGNEEHRWVERVAEAVAGVRSYLPPEASPDGAAVRTTHGPEDAEQRARSRFWVLGDAQGIVGTVAVHPGKGGDHQAGGPADPAVAVFARFGLSPELRGRGLGQKLYEVAESFCVEDGAYTRMWLETSRRQKAARVVYERNGWELLESVDNLWEDDLLGKELPKAPAL